MSQEVQQAIFLLEEHEDLKVVQKHRQEAFTAEILAERRKASSLWGQLDQEVQSHTATAKNGWRMIKDFKAEQEALSQKEAIERDVLQQNTVEKERHFERARWRS